MNLTTALECWDRFLFAPDPRENAKKTETRRQALRFVFYLILSVDTYLLSRDPYMTEYGGSAAASGFGFHVSKIPLLFEYNPLIGSAMHGESLAVLWDATCALSLAASVGLYEKPAKLCIAALYSTAYFGTELDMFQHHYLLCSVLWILAFWDRGVRWCPRLLSVQLAVVYAFAVVTKVSNGPTYVSGTYAPEFSMVYYVHAAVDSTAAFLGIDARFLWMFMAVSVLAAEAFLSLALVLSAGRFCRGCRAAALVVGVSLHVVLQIGGSLLIRFFSFYMIAFYIPLLPDAVVFSSSKTD